MADAHRLIPPPPEAAWSCRPRGRNAAHLCAAPAGPPRDEACL